MKHKHLIATAFMLASLDVIHATESKITKKPNIVFILFDDMGYGQPQSYNAESALRTPNLDRFAQQGMRFTDAHSAAAVCTPTRYGILTGRYPSRIGQFGVLTTFSKPIIPTNRLTVASMLKKQGYSTACIGKWHLGLNWLDGKPGTEDEVPIGAKFTEGPNALGFDYFLGFTHARNIGTIIEQNSVVAHVKPVENQPLMIKKAIEWIDGRAKSEEPFFLYFPMCPPHEPIVPSEEYVDKSGAQDLVNKNPKYGDWLYQGDAMLGQILETLDRNHLAENTLVIVASDNGAEHRAYEPLRESKRSIYEGGHRIPFMIRWPGIVKPGMLNYHTVCLNDFMATAAEIAGVKLPANAGEDSKSLLPEFLGTAGKGVREATVHQSAYGDLAIRQGPWKLVFLISSKQELYNLHDDLSETKDVAAANPDIVKKMTVLMKSYIANGRSIPGKMQKNDKDISIDGKLKGLKSKKSKKEVKDASDPSFD
jgi:arylsulfatase A-like enzyme